MGEYKEETWRTGDGGIKNIYETSDGTRFESNGEYDSYTKQRAEDHQKYLDEQWAREQERIQKWYEMCEEDKAILRDSYNKGDYYAVISYADGVISRAKDWDRRWLSELGGDYGLRDMAEDCRAVACLIAGYYDKAINDLKDLDEKYRRFSDKYFFVRGFAYEKKGQKDKASVDFLKALDYYCSNYSFPSPYDISPQPIGPADYVSKSSLVDLCFEQIFPTVKARAEEGDERFYKFLADFYYRGFGTAKDENAAHGWYEKAVAAEDSDAYMAVSSLHFKGDCGYSYSDKLKLEYLRKAASKGVKLAKRYLFIRKMRRAGFLNYAVGLERMNFFKIIMSAVVSFLAFAAVLGLYSDVHGGMVEIDNYYMMLIPFGLLWLFSFIIIMWKHVVILILLVLMNIAGCYGIFNIIKTDQAYFFPPAISAPFTSEKTREQTVTKKAELHPTLGASPVAKTLHNEAAEYLGTEIMTIPPGSFVTIISSSGTWAEVDYKGNKGWVKNISRVKADFSAKVAKDTSLLAEPEYYTTVIKTIKKGEGITLLGKGSDIYIYVEHDGDKGWVHQRNVRW